MKRYLIGGLTVDIEADCERLLRTGKAYESDVSGNADITVVLKEEILNYLIEKYPNLTRDELEYLATGTLFHYKLAAFNGVMLHSSCIMYNGMGYLFSADSGTGKSTHTGLWKDVFGDDVIYINDDKPIIRLVDGEYRVFGTPWSGKTDLNNNVSAPVGAIVFLHRSDENSCRRMDVKNENAAVLFLEQAAKPKSEALLRQALVTADDILRRVPVFSLGCNISKEAVYTSYRAIVPPEKQKS